MARQLKGGKRNETRQEKKERRALNREIKSQFTTIVLPTLGAIALVIVAFVYLKTRQL